MALDGGFSRNDGGLGVMNRASTATDGGYSAGRGTGVLQLGAHCRRTSVVPMDRPTPGGSLPVYTVHKERAR